MEQGGARQFDVVGIGALNLDYIVTAVPDLALGVERGTESVADRATISRLLDMLGPESVLATPGGSAFNTIFALAQLGRGLRLGYVGVCGAIPAHGRSAVDALRIAGVDTSAVFSAPATLSGVCVALVDGGERTLLTHPGANTHLARMIDEHFDELIGYLARAKIVHVTSLLDDATPKKLVRLLTALPSHARPFISFDPGHVWCADRSDQTLALTRISDLLLLNASEFRALGQAEPADGDLAVAQRVLDLMATPSSVALVKRPDGVTVFSKDGDRVALSVVPQVPVDAQEIVDATGAGDVFAAGLLAALALPGHRLMDGVRLGMLLARHGLRHHGTTGHRDFAELTCDLLAGPIAESLIQEHTEAN